MRKRRVATAALAVAIGTTGLALAPSPAEAQRLEEYDYENLRLRGVGAEVFYVSPHDLDGTLGFGARLDLGFLGPRIRVVPRFAFWDSELEEAALDSLAAKLEDLVQEQNPQQPRPEIDLGRVERDAIIFGTDLHWLPLVEEPIRPYLGAGAEIYILDGTGDAIADTFVEDGLDLLTAGVSGVAGLEVDLRRGIALYGELRGSLVADVRNVAVTAGVAYIAP